LSNFYTGKFSNPAAKTNPITVPPKAYLLKNLRDGLDQNLEKNAREKRIFRQKFQPAFGSA
jgi:hypothetical protein